MPAERLVAALRAAGIEVWWDALVAGGEAFARTIEARLDSVDVVLVAWSATSIASDWVRDEAAHGRDRRRFVAVTLDGSLPPLGFRQYHAIDLSTWVGDGAAPAFEAVLRGIERAAGGAAEAAPLSEPAPRPAAPAAPRFSRRAAIAALAVAGMGGGAGFWALRAPGSSAPNSIAVLPFRNLGDQANQGWFSDGLAEEIRITLSSIAQLAVAAPTSSNQFRASAEDARQVARKLGVAWLLEGAVQRADDVLRVSVSLIDGAGGLTTWSQNFERPLKDVFAVEREIATAVAAAVAGRATSAADMVPADIGGTTNVAAYDLYLQANALFDLDTSADTYNQAAALIERALAIDPAYARAYVLQSRILMLLRNSYATSGEQMAMLYDRSLLAVRKALAITPRLPSAHVVLGYALLADTLNFATAMPEYAAARSLAPDDPEIALSYANFIFKAGQNDAAVAAMAFAEQRDPLNPFVYRIQGLIELFARRFDTAAARFTHALSLNPALEAAHSYLGDVHLAQGRNAAARAEYAREPNRQLGLAGLAIAAHRLGDAAGSRAAREALVREFGDAVMYQQAQVAAQTGPVDAALAVLARARAVKDPGMMFVLGDFKLDPLRHRPEFVQMLAQMGLGRT